MYDTHCAELARLFLSDLNRENDEKLVAEFAQHIQDAVELFLTDIEPAPK